MRPAVPRQPRRRARGPADRPRAHGALHAGARRGQADPQRGARAGGAAAAPAAGGETGESAASARSDSAGGVPRTPAPLAEQHSIDALKERISELESLV